MSRSRLFSLYFLTTVMIIGVSLALEFAVRHYEAASAVEAESVQQLMLDLPKMSISGREVGNQMLAHNVALFSHYPSPELVSVGYVGTSRSKVLRPEHFGMTAAVVGAGNTYNEITYGLLLQAEILRLRFPQLKRVYFESSFLLRRPARLIIEDDHKKYLPLLRTLLPLCMGLPADAGCRQVFDSLSALQQQPEQARHSELVKKRGEFRISSLFSKEKKGMSVMDDPLLAGLQSNGERVSLSRAHTPRDEWLPEINNDHIKVQRMRDIRSYGSGDGLFELIALWGRKHNIEVIFFQPPVRSDLYRFQVEYGLARHVADIERISRAYKTPFIDLNRPELGFMKEWSLFSDEDHLETCIGSGLLTLALEDGYKIFRKEHELFPVLNRSHVQAGYKRQLNICNQQQG